MLEFKRDEDRERHAHEFEMPGTHGHGSLYGSTKYTLANYFKSMGEEGEDTVFGTGLHSDGVYRRPRETKRIGARASVSDFADEAIELSLEKQCETADVLPQLLGYLKYDDFDAKTTAEFERLMFDPKDEAAQHVLKDLALERDIWPEDWMKAATKVMQFQAWLSGQWYHHAQSIEGDYECFDMFEANWMMTQRLPRQWTRQGLLILHGTLDPRHMFVDDHPSLEDLRDELVNWRSPEYAEQLRIGIGIFPSEGDLKRATSFWNALDIEWTDLRPTLQDFFQ